MHRDSSFWIGYASTKSIGGSAMQSEWGHSQKCRGPKIGLKALTRRLYHAQRFLILDRICFNKIHWWECYAIRMRSLTKVQRPKDRTQSPHSQTVPCTKIPHSGSIHFKTHWWDSICNLNEVIDSQNCRGLKTGLNHSGQHKLRNVVFRVKYKKGKIICHLIIMISSAWFPIAYSQRPPHKPVHIINMSGPSVSYFLSFYYQSVEWRTGLCCVLKILRWVQQL